MDPDLLLAIALSQSLMEKEVSPTTLDNSTHEAQDSLKLLSLENVKETDYLQVYFEKLVDALRKDVLHEHLSLLPPLSKLLVDGPAHFTSEQIEFLAHFLKFVSTCIKISDLAKYSPDGVELIGVTCRGILKFIVEAIEHLCNYNNPNQAQPGKVYKQQITTLKDLLFIVDLLCTIDQSLHSTGPTLRTEFKLSIFPRFSEEHIIAPSSSSSSTSPSPASKSSETASPEPSSVASSSTPPSPPSSSSSSSPPPQGLMALIASPPQAITAVSKTKEEGESDADIKILEDALSRFMRFDESREPGHSSRLSNLSMDDMLKRFEEYFEKDLKGVSRLLRASSNFTLPPSMLTIDLSSTSPVLPIATSLVIESKTQLNDLLDRLEFTQKVLELLASTHLLPCDKYKITDVNAAPWLFHSCLCLLTLHRAEEIFYRKTQVPKQVSDSDTSSSSNHDDDPEPCLIERSMLDDILYISEKLSDSEAERSIQVTLVLGILGSFNELSSTTFEPSSLPAIPAFNPDLVELALQVAKSILNPLQSHAENKEKDKGTWKYIKEQHGPISQVGLSQGRSQPELVLDASQWHSGENAVQYLLNGPVLLDNLFYLLVVTYAQSGKTADSAPQQKKVEVIRPSAMETDTDVTQDDDNIFGALFSESRPTSFKGEPARSETVYIDNKYDDDAIDLAKRTLFSLPVHEPLVRKQLSIAHVDALIYIASSGYNTPALSKPPLEDAVFLEGFRRVAHHITTSSYLSATLQEHLVRSMLSLFPLSRECVHLLARLLVARRATARTAAATDDILILEMWDRYFSSLSSGESEGIALEYLELLLLAFYMLHETGKNKVLTGAFGALSSLYSATASLSASDKKAKSALSISSLVLTLNLLQYILCNPTAPSAELVSALDYHIFSTSETKVKEKRTESPVAQQSSAKEHRYIKYFYSLPSINTTKQDQIFTVISSHTNYDTTYKLLCDMLHFGPSGDLVVDDYLFYTLWQLLQQLPPSVQFLGALKDPNMFQSKPTNTMLITLYWLSKFATGVIPTGTDPKLIAEVPLYQHYMTCASLLTNIAEKIQRTQIEVEGLRVYSIVYSLVQFASVPFRAEPALPESQATPLASAFTHSASVAISSISQEYRRRVSAQVKLQQQQRGNQQQLPPTPPPLPPTSQSTVVASPPPPPPPPPPPSKHSAVASSPVSAAVAHPHPLEDSTMALLLDLSKAGAPVVVVTSLLPYPTHPSAAILSPSSISSGGTLTPLAPAIPSLCHTTSGEISVQSLLTYILTVCVVVIHHAKDASDSKGLIAALMDIVHDSLFGFAESTITPLFAALVSAKQDREIILGTALAGHIVELAVSHARDPVAVTYTVDTLRSPSKNLHLATYFLPHTPETPALADYSARRGLEVWLEVLRGVHEEMPNQEALGLMCEMALQDPRLREGFTKGMLSLSHEALSSWLQEKLLGHKSGDAVVSPPVQENVIRFLYILAFGDDINSSLASLKMDINPPPPTQFEFELFDHLLGLLRVAFDTYFQNAKEYFVFLQVLAVHTNQLPKLMLAVIGMLPEIQPHFASQQQKALSVTSVWTQFLSTILAHCKKVILEHSQPTPMHVEKPVEKKEDKKDEEKEKAKEIEEKEMEAIAGKCCTYAQTGNNYTEQHWYFCYTCKLMGLNGCCTVCARVCHRGHDVGYSRFSRFFCDCGASTTAPCKSLKPIKYKSSRFSSQSKEQASKKSSRTPHVLKMVEQAAEPITPGAPELPVAAPLPQPIIASLLGVVSKESLVDTLFPLLNQLLQILKQDNVEKAPMEDIPVKRDLFTETKKLETTVDVFSLKRSIKAGAFDVKLAETRDSRKVIRRALDSNSRRRIAVGEQDRVIIVQLPKLLEDLPATTSSIPAPPPPPSPTASPPPPPPAYVQIDKSTVKTHAVAAVGFEVMSVTFNPSNENYLAVCGPRECRVLTLNSRDEVIDQLSVELALDGGNAVLKSAWLPGSQVKIGIIASQCVKVFDLSRDALSPLYYFTLLEDTVRDAVFAQRNGATAMLLISATGMLFAQPLGSLQDGPCIITDTLFVPPHLSGTSGASLYFSNELDLLFATYSDGKCVALRLNPTFTEVLGGFIVSPSSPPPSKTATAPTVASIAPHTSFVELESVPGSLVALSYSSPLARAQAPLVGVSITMDEVRLQGLKPSPSTTSSKSGPRVEGLTVVGGKRQSVLILLDDGSLHRYDPIVFAEPEVKREVEGEAVATPTTSVAKPPAAPRAKSSSKKEVAQPPPPKPAASSAPPPVFPMDFFEKVECITSSIQYGGDALATNTSDAIHQKLGSNEEYLASTSTDTFTLTVVNPFPYTVMVGVRILIGSASLQHIPKEIRIFDRVVKTHESVRRWYDIPFTQAESISAEHEFSLVFSGTHSGNANPPIIDSVEVYGQPKEEFGWDAVLAQNAANSQPAHDPQSVAKMGSAEVALYYTLSALHHYLLLAPPPLPNIDEMKQGLPLPSSPPATATAALLSRLPVLLNDPLLPAPLRTLVKSLLLALCHNHPARYSELKDAIQLRYVADIMVTLSKSSSSTSSPSSAVLDHCLRTLCRVSRHRPSHLAMCVRLVGGSFSTALLRLTQTSLNPSGGLAPIPEKTASALVEILFTYIVMMWEKDYKASTAAMRDLAEVLSSSPQSAATSLGTRITDAQQQYNDPTVADTEMQDASTQAPHESTGEQSVEYQCDSCKALILDQRWHCNQCADYDLCDKCHKNNAESATHITAHAMTNLSIPPTAQSSITLADDDYAMQEAPEDEELEKAIALSMVEGATPSEQSVVPVGPPKPLSTPSTVLERLLEVVLDQFKNIRGRGGMATIPYLQVVHVLTKKLSANGLPPARLILRIVQVLMPQQLSSRGSPAAEEDYLSLVLFWILLGKAKKAPTTDGASTSAQTYANVVKMLVHDTNLVDKLYGVASELLQQFKRSSKPGEASASGSAEARVPGALLTERSAASVVTSTPSSTPFNASPFFSETFARSHKDLFHNFPKILSEVVMRLVLAIYSCASKQDQAIMHKEQWEELLCSFIQSEQASFVHKHCKRLLLSLTGNRESYYLLRDKAFLSSGVRKVLSITQDIATIDMTYEQSVKLVECLQKIEETINLRPHNWLLFCTEHPSVRSKKDTTERPIVPFLLGIVFYLREEAALLVLKLLVYLFADDKSSKKAQTSKKETPRSSSSEETLSPELIEQLEKARKGQVNVLLQDRFTQLVNVCLLEYNSSAIRLEARNLIHKIWQYADWNQKVTIFQVQTPTQEAHDLVVNLVNLIAPVFHTQNKVLANHPNSYLYRTLSSLVDVEGYYLESEPCLVCNDPELHFVNARLETLKSEMKFTDKTHLIKFNSTYTIASLNLHISDIKKTKMVRTVNIYHTNKVVGDLGELRNKWALWKKVRTFSLQPEQSDVSVSLPICVNANNLLIEYAEFYENLSVMASEKLQCPRCSRTVTDKHGICKHCHENAFQYINYENLHAFLCNECGYCKYGKFEYSLAVKPSYAADKIESEEDHKKTQQTIEKESEAATKNAQQLAAYRRPLVRLVAMLHDRDATPREEKEKPKEKEEKKEKEKDKEEKTEKGDSSNSLLSTITISASDSQTLSLARVNKRVALLALLYGKECKSVFENLSKAVQVMLAAKRELIRYMSKGRPKSHTHETKSRPANRCYGCAIACVTQILTLASHLLAAAPITPTPSPSPSLVHEALVKGYIVEGILNCTMYQGDSRVRSGARAVLCAVSKDSEATTNIVLERIKTKIMYGLDNHLIVDLATTVYNEVLLLKEISSVDDKLWDQRLKLVLEIFFFTLQNLSHNPVVAEHVVLPLLRVLVTICVPSLTVTKEDKPKEVIPKESKKRDEKAIKEAKDKLAFFGLLAKPSSSRHASPPQPPVVPSSTVPHSPPLPQSPVASSPIFEDTPTLAYNQWASGAPPKSEGGMAYDEWASKFGNMLIHPPAAKSVLPVHEQRLARKYALRWKQRIAERKAGGEEMEDEGDLLDVLISNSWLKSLLFHTSSISIRAETAVLVEELSKGSPQRRLRMLDLMTQLLESAGEGGETSTEFFSLYKKLVEQEDRKLYLTVKGFLPYICALISKEIDRIVKLENAYTTDTSQGFVLMTTISLLASFLNVPTIRAKFKRDDQLYHSEETKKGKRVKRNEHHLLERVLDAFLSLRGIILNKTKFIDDSLNLLQGLLKLVNSENYEDNQMFMAACIKALDNHEEGRTPIFIFEQLCNIVKPPRAEPVYMLTLNKMPSQEEFIRGSMTKNPYSSTDVGPLMRDVKNKICRTLDLRGLLDDDNGMELLVHSKIIKLDLPVGKVYEHVWRRGVNPDNTTAEAGPMQVVYRLQGLDGEATEEIVDKIVTPLNEANQIDPEEEYKITAIMTKCGGLHAMKRFLNKIHDFGATDKELANLVLRLLFYSCKLKVNRLGMIELGMMDVLLDKVRLVFGKEDLADAAEMILLIIESIVEQMYISEDSKMYVDSKESDKESIQAVGTDDAISQMAMFLDNFASPLVRNNPKVTKTMTRIIPFLTYGNESVMKVLVNYLIPYLNFEDYDANHTVNAQQTLYLDAFIAILDSIRKGLRLKSLILESGSVETMVKYLVKHFPKSKASDSFAESMQNAALPYVLSLLTGLSRFHAPTQLALHSSPGVIPGVHTMEGMVTVAKVPALAENLLEALRTENPEVAVHVDEIRHTTKAEKLKQAEQHRLGVLKSLGLLQTDGGKITANVVPKSIEELEEDTGLTCMVCREGYSYKPNEVLGFYTFSKRVPLSWLSSTTGSSSQGSHPRGENGYTTVTHFNVIHFSCHRDATKAEKGLKVPKEEWEGAALRNQQTKCNAIFPLSGPKVSDDSFIAHMDKFWAYLTNVGRVETARFRVLTHDIKFAFLRFAREESFSTDSKGGGKESNIRAIPFLIAGGLAMLDQRSNPQRAAYEKAFSTFASMAQDSWDASHPLSDNVLYMLVLSLFVQSGQQWQAIRLSFLKRLLGFAGVEYRATRAREEAASPATPPTPSSPSPSSPPPSSSSSSSLVPEEVFKTCRPLFIFFTFIDQIHTILKPATKPTPSSSSSTTTTSSTTSATSLPPTTTGSEWVTHLMTQVKTNPVKLQNDFRELLATFEDELTAYESFMEFADFLGLLPAIMTETPDCNDFMLKYIGPQNSQ